MPAKCCWDGGRGGSFCGSEQRCGFLATVRDRKLFWSTFTVAGGDKTPPRIQKHFPESKTRPRIQLKTLTGQNPKHVPESKNTFQNAKHVLESKPYTSKNPKTSQNPKHFWILRWYLVLLLGKHAFDCPWVHCCLLQKFTLGTKWNYKIVKEIFLGFKKMNCKLKLHSKGRFTNKFWGS